MNIDAPPRRLLWSAALVYLLSIAGVLFLLLTYRPAVPAPIAVRLRADPDAAAGTYWLQGRRAGGASLTAAELPGVLKSTDANRPAYFRIVSARPAVCPDDGFRVTLHTAAETPATKDKLTGFVYRPREIEQELYRFIME